MGSFYVSLLSEGVGLLQRFSVLFLRPRNCVAL
jgi:hypothetical protein